MSDRTLDEACERIARELKLNTLNYDIVMPLREEAGFLGAMFDLELSKKLVETLSVMTGMMNDKAVVATLKLYKIFLEDVIVSTMNKSLIETALDNEIRRQRIEQ